MSAFLPDFYDDLDASLEQAWALLVEGAATAATAAHTPTLVTSTGALPSARTVVLRRCEPELRRLCMHTDRRSAKVGEIAANPAGVLHVYDAAAKIQLRLELALSLHFDDDLAATQWAASRPMSRAAYQVRLAPGTAQAEATAAFDDSQSGRDNFAVVAGRVDYLEWLYLNAAGHRRAGYRWRGATRDGTWLVP